MQIMRLPVGIEDFEEIRNDGRTDVLTYGIAFSESAVKWYAAIYENNRLYFIHDKYFSNSLPVGVFNFAISSGIPSPIMHPPDFPAPGPISII